MNYSEYYDKIICVSEQDHDIGTSYGLINMPVIYPGVDVYKFNQLPPCKNDILHFVYYGRIAPNKGIYECLIKLSELNSFVFDIIGLCEDHEYMKKLQDVIINYSLQNKVNFVGRKTNDEIKQYLSSCDYILFPSLYEGFGMTLTETLLSGKKIIANTNTSFKKILTTVKASQYLFDFENNSTHLIDKIKELEKTDILPQNVQQYSEEEMLRRIEIEYDNIK